MIHGVLSEAEQQGEWLWVNRGCPHEFEQHLREWLWINHGCPVAVLYGDDGEMQCNALGCMLDFKKTPLAELVLLLIAKGHLHAGQLPRWQPIDTAPKMRTVLLFAVTDIAEDGTVLNWKMATGSYNTGYEDERSRLRGYTPWTWGGNQLKTYEVQPTHWMPLPQALVGGVQ